MRLMSCLDSIIRIFHFAEQLKRLRRGDRWTLFLRPKNAADPVSRVGAVHGQRGVPGHVVSQSEKLSASQQRPVRSVNVAGVTVSLTFVEMLPDGFADVP